MDKLKSFLVCLCTFSIPFIIGFANDKSLLAPDGTTVEITRDGYGVPHISAESEVGVFFGQFTEKISFMFIKNTSKGFDWVCR